MRKPLVSTSGPVMESMTGLRCNGSKLKTGDNLVYLRRSLLRDKWYRILKTKLFPSVQSVEIVATNHNVQIRVYLLLA